MSLNSRLEGFIEAVARVVVKERKICRLFIPGNEFQNALTLIPDNGLHH